MLFSTLQSLLSPGAALKLDVTKNDDETLSIIVCPKGNTGALSQPLVLTGTVEELDAGFIDILQQYQSKRQSLQEQLEATSAVLDAAKKSEENKAVKALTGKSTPTVQEKIVAKSSDNDDDDDLESHGEAPASTSASSPAPNAVAGDLANLFD